MHRGKLDYSLSQGKPLRLDNTQIAAITEAWQNFAAMSGLEKSFRDQIADAMLEQGLTKADLSRKSGVPYHGLDKFLKGNTARTSAENVRALSRALGISLEGDAQYEELRALYFALPEEKRQFVLDQLRGLLGASR